MRWGADERNYIIFRQRSLRKDDQLRAARARNKQKTNWPNLEEEEDEEKSEWNGLGTEFETLGHTPKVAVQKNFPGKNP